MASRAQGETDAPLTAEEAIELQRTVGNRATTAVVQRDVLQRDKVAGKKAESRWKVESLLAPYPVLARAMTFDQMRGWQEILDVFAQDEQVKAELGKYDWSEHIFFVDGKPQGNSEWVDRYEAIAAKRPAGYDGSKARVELDMDQILASEVLGEQPWNVAAEHKFRQWLRTYLERHPFVAEFTTRAEMVPGYLINSDETMAALSRGGVPHVALTWGGYTVSNTGGRVGWDDIKDMPEVKLEHEIQVTKSLAVWELGVHIPPLSADIAVMTSDHLDLIARSKKHPVVRWLSEEVSAPSGLELMMARMNAESNPDDEDAQGKYFAAQLKAAPMPGIEIWTAPREACDRAGTLLAEGKFELATAVYNEADRLTQLAAMRFNTYEDRVMEGAAGIVKWLNRLKTAGKVASMFTGAGGLSAPPPSPPATPPSRRARSKRSPTGSTR